ncbi:MAG: CRISPR-associated protein Csx20 [Desulfobulbaceae bacterium]|nr:CRISPR-associated protein Csx20 [Desulfobulbaceae bacterium]
MPDLFLLFNHTFTKVQQAGARQDLKVDRILVPPATVQEIWSSIPPDLEEIFTYLQPVLQWLESTAQHGDYVLVQGDFGACCLVARHARQSGLIPVYSTTFRQSEERHLPDGRVELIHTFRHVRFRRFEM